MALVISVYSTEAEVTPTGHGHIYGGMSASVMHHSGVHVGTLNSCFAGVQ